MPSNLKVKFTHDNMKITSRKLGGMIMGGVGIIFLVIVAVIIVIAIVQSRHIFVCSNCGKEFRPKWTQLISDVHVCDEHLIDCPFCNVKNMCKDKRKT